jgi:lysine-N-methylase
MPLPVRSLPVLQNWDCQGCSACCRHYHVSVSTEEKKLIEGQGWDKEPEFQDIPMFVRVGGLFSKSYRFHNRHGSAGKPLACRIYPYTLVPAGDHWKLSIRFACPSAADNVGKPLAEHLKDANEYAALLEGEWGTAAITRLPPNLQGSQTVTWNDLFRIVAAISKILANEDDAIERRWRKVLFVVSTLRKARFDGKGDAEKAVTGGRLSELLHILAMASGDEIPEHGDAVPPPGWVGRMVFRPLVALYARKDTGPDRGTAQAGLSGRLFSAIQFARGTGKVPHVHAAITNATFDDADKPLGKLSEKSLSLLTRWARVKIESVQFCGPTNFGLGVWDGLESLAATFPAAMWLARVLIAGGRPIEEAILLAVRIVDDNFGFNKLLGSARQKFALRLLAARGELPKLIAWYGR